MTIKDRYGVTQASWQAMIKDGIISCSVAGYEDIITKVKAKRASGMSNGQAVKITSVEVNISERRIYKILEQFK
jgi:uncharacterized protein YoaH (UPF0181 family)